MNLVVLHVIWRGNISGQRSWNPHSCLEIWFSVRLFCLHINTNIPGALGFTWWRQLVGIAQFLILHKNLLTILQHKNHSWPLRLTWISPRMHCSPLHSDITSPHKLYFPTIKYHLYFSLDNDSVVEGLCAMHHACIVWRKIDVTADSAFAVIQTERFGCHEVVVGFDVFVIV